MKKAKILIYIRKVLISNRFSVTIPRQKYIFERRLGYVRARK